MNKINNWTLVKIASVTGFLTSAMGMAYYWQLNGKIARQPYYKDAVNYIKSHAGVKHVLGEPILIGKIDIGHIGRSDYFADNTNAYFGIPIKGPKEKATMYFWANKTTDDDKWEVNRIELELKSIKEKRFLVMSTGTDTPSVSE